MADFDYKDANKSQAPDQKGQRYTGTLPKYCKKTNRRKLIRILCQGKCGNRTRWAELNQFYPGMDVINESDPGTYEARCLKCKKIDTDISTWFR